MLILTYNGKYVIVGLICVVLVLLARYLSLFIPVKLFSKKLEFIPHTTKIMTWGGLRGGISIALALSLPYEMNRDLFLIITYIVVVFSILVQGLSIGIFATKLIGKEHMVVDDSH
jgi:CPA1 family monovalent cation:H+ antiporter